LFIGHCSRRKSLLTIIADNDDMDLVSAITGLQQAKLQSQAQILVAKKILDAQGQQGAGAVQLLQTAEHGIDQAGDALVAAATGLGGQLDIKA
jgi:hypothetical protein